MSDISPEHVWFRNWKYCMSEINNSKGKGTINYALIYMFSWLLELNFLKNPAIMCLGNIYKVFNGWANASLVFV